jgi:hypothetical protein
MSVTEQLDKIIADLQAAREDAAKVDSGKAGTPGTRVRKTASEAAKSLKGLRQSVLDARNSG